MEATVGSSIPASAIVVTEKCYIRPYETTDAEASSACANDPDVSKWLTYRFPSPYRLEDAHFFINNIALARKPCVNFAIVKLDGTFVGGIGLVPRSDVEYRTHELGYWTGKESWGQGIATAAVKAFSKWAFKAFPELLRLEANHFAPNIGSGRVLEKSGFTREACLKQAFCKNEVVMDKVVYGLLRQDVDGLES